MCNKKTSSLSYFGTQDNRNNVPWSMMIESKQLVRTYTNPAIKDMAKISTGKGQSKEVNTSVDLVGRGVIRIGKSSISISDMDTSLCNMNPSTFKVFSMLNNKMTRNAENVLDVTLTIQEYLELTGKDNTESSRRNARRELKNQIDLLKRASIYCEWVNPRTNEKVTFDGVVIQSRIHFSGGWVVKFGEDFARMMRTYGQICLPDTFFKLNTQSNPHLLSMAYYLSTHYYHYENIKKGVNHRLSVRSILANVPSIPSESDVKNRKYKECILNPFENTLDALCEQGVLKEWTYCHPNGVPVTDKELATYTYRTIMDFLVDFTFNATPDFTELMKIRPRLKGATSKSKEQPTRRTK